MNLTLSGELLQELRKKYRYLRIVPDAQDGHPVLQAIKAITFTIGGKNYEGPGHTEWDEIAVCEPPPNTRTVTQIYPNRIWDIEELL